QHRGAIVRPLRRGPFMRLGRHRQVPLDLVLDQAQRLAEAADGVQHVDARAVRDALVDEQAVQVLGAGTVVADPAPRRHEGRQHVGARRHLQLQQHVEPLRRQLPAQGAHPGQAAALVVDVEGDVLQPFQQAPAARIDDPVQVEARPGALQRPYQRDHVGDVAQGGQAQQADRGAHRSRGVVRLARMVAFDANEALSPYRAGSGYGAILFDRERLRQAGPELFSPAAWGERARPVDSGGRGSAWFVDAPFGPCVLRHYLRGGLAASVSRDRYVWRGAARTRSFAEFRLMRVLLG